MITRRQGVGPNNGMQKHQCPDAQVYKSTITLHHGDYDGQWPWSRSDQQLHISSAAVETERSNHQNKRLGLETK